jgi:hypothetical protein
MKVVLRKLVPTIPQTLTVVCMVIGVEIIVLGWLFGYAGLWSILVATVTSGKTPRAPQIIQDAPHFLLSEQKR